MCRERRHGHHDCPVFRSLHDGASAPRRGCFTPSNVTRVAVPFAAGSTRIRSRAAASSLGPSTAGSDAVAVTSPTSASTAASASEPAIASRIRNASSKADPFLTAVDPCPSSEPAADPSGARVTGSAAASCAGLTRCGPERGGRIGVVALDDGALHTPVLADESLICDPCGVRRTRHEEENTDQRERDSCTLVDGEGPTPRSGTRRVRSRRAFSHAHHLITILTDLAASAAFGAGCVITATVTSAPRGGSLPTVTGSGDSDPAVGSSVSGLPASPCLRSIRHGIPVPPVVGATDPFDAQRGVLTTMPGEGPRFALGFVFSLVQRSHFRVDPRPRSDPRSIAASASDSNASLAARFPPPSFSAATSASSSARVAWTVRVPFGASADAYVTVTVSVTIRSATSATSGPAALRSLSAAPSATTLAETQRRSTVTSSTVLVTGTPPPEAFRGCSVPARR